MQPNEDIEVTEKDTNKDIQNEMCDELQPREFKNEIKRCTTDTQCPEL